MLKAAIDGAPQLKQPIPELNIPNLEPFLIPELTIAGSGAVQVTQHFKNSGLYGITNVDIKKLE